MRDRSWSLGTDFQGQDHQRRKERSVLEPGDRLTGQSWIAIATTGLGGMAGNLFGGILQDTLGLPVLLQLCSVMTVAGVAIAVAGLVRAAVLREMAGHVGIVRRLLSPDWRTQDSMVK